MQALTLAQVCEKVGLKRSFVYSLAANQESHFPRPAKIGKRSVWSSAEIDEWLSRQFAKRAEAGNGKAA